MVSDDEGHTFPLTSLWGTISSDPESNLWREAKITHVLKVPATSPARDQVYLYLPPRPQRTAVGPLLLWLCTWQ